MLSCGIQLLPSPFVVRDRCMIWYIHIYSDYEQQCHLSIIASTLWQIIWQLDMSHHENLLALRSTVLPRQSDHMASNSIHFCDTKYVSIVLAFQISLPYFKLSWDQHGSFPLDYLSIKLASEPPSPRHLLVVQYQLSSVPKSTFVHKTL